MWLDKLTVSRDAKRSYCGLRVLTRAADDTYVLTSSRRMNRHIAERHEIRAIVVMMPIVCEPWGIATKLATPAPIDRSTLIEA